MNYEPINLVEMKRGGDTWRLTSVSGNTTWGGFTWIANHPQFGVIKSVEGWEENPDQVSARDLVFSSATWLHDELRANRQNFTVSIRAGRRNSDGSLTTLPTVWQGMLSLVPVIGMRVDPITIEFAGRTAFDTLGNAVATYSTGYRSKLYPGTDTAFDRSGGVIASDTGGVPGSGGQTVTGDELWDYDNRWQR